MVEPELTGCPLTFASNTKWTI